MRLSGWFPFCAVALIAGCHDPVEPAVVSTATSAATAQIPAVSQVASLYAIDFVSPAATAYDLNDAGDVVGRSYRDTGCGPFCLPPEDIVVWRAANRIVLPLVPAVSVSYQMPLFLNNQGVIGGQAGYPGSATRAAVWTPNGAGYSVRDLGVFPGTSSADVAGIDEQGRIVGWATLGGAIPSLTVPYMWSPATGMVNLRTLGFPNERPAAMSPNGKVVTWNSWYQLGVPSSVRQLPSPPAGFLGAGSNGSSINDAGDQAHFLVSTSTQNLVYPFRLPNVGTWQLLSNAGTGRLARYKMGSINSALDVTFTARSTGMVAPGPSGLAIPLSSLVSPAYPGATISDGGPMNTSGQILSRALIGRSERVVKLTPAVPCGGNCIVVSSLTMIGRFVQDPALPGSCVQGGKMYNLTTATAIATSETGAPLANVQVSGRFMDDYWTNNPVTGTTNGAGVVTWTHKGPCGVGAVAFFIDNATLGTRRLDRTRGRLTNFVIPTVGPPVNQPPVASFTFNCNNTTRACSFNGAGSTDDVGVVSYAWTFGNGTTGAGVAPSHTYATAGTYTVTLTVTDGSGLTNSLSKTVTLTSGANRAPIAAWTVTCQPAPAHSCTFDGRASSDSDGSIVSYRWTTPSGFLLSSAASFSRSFDRSMTLTWTLTVTDNAGATGLLSKTFTVP